MALVPKKNGEMLAWFEAHNTPWTTNATAIGTTAAAVTDLATKVATARAAMAAQLAAQQTAKAATTALDASIGAVQRAGSALIMQVRAKAQTVGGTSVYSLAQIPPPTIPSPGAPPGAPYEVAATLATNGSLELTWKARNPGGGVIYMVYRRDTPTGDFNLLGGTGERRLVDATLPAGSSQVTYKLQGVRPTAAGPWTELNVNIGAGAAAATSAAMKLAA